MPLPRPLSVAFELPLRLSLRLLSVGLLLVAFGCEPGEVLAQSGATGSSYPTWFRSMPAPGPALWAVGYARGYGDLETGMEEARADAYERLRRTRRAVVEGEKLYESAPGFQMSFEGAFFTETGLPDTLRSVTYADSAMAGGMTLVLAAWAPSGEPPRTLSAPEGRAPFPEEPPSWVRNGAPDGPKMKRAVGRARRYYYLENSWRRAERRARRRLAFQATAKVERLEKSTEDWRHGVTSIETKARLRRVQATARWAGEETCYVLVEGRVEEASVE